ncbi:MAG: hypothetical protein OEM38_05460 [Gammaproteobacteria bacterium]|nr:hypothetical protein [Gammaproteobacteria bacterium]
MNELEDNLNDYISGTISFLSYRERRSNYINSFVNSGYLPDDTIPLNSIEQQQIKETVSQRIKNNNSLDTTKLTLRNGTSDNTKKQYIGLIILITIAAATWYYSTKLPAPSSTATATTTLTENKAPDTPAAVTFDRPFVVNFVKMDKWSSETSSDFLIKWQALSRTEKKQTKQSQSFIRLKNSLRLRILEQQALQNTKNKQAERQENLLIWFASQLSIAVS